MAKLKFLLLTLLAVYFSPNDAQNVNRQQTLKVGSILAAPFLQLKNNDTLTGSNQDFEGFIIDLLDALGHNYQIVIPEDRKYGQFDVTTGKWNGMVGMVQDRKVDLIAADITVTSKRTEVMDFSVPFMSSRLTVLTKLAQGEDSNVWPLIISPFDLTLWLLLVAAFLVSSFVFFLVKRISPYERIWSITKARNVPDITLNDSLWIMIACFFHGTKPPAKAVSSRLLVAGWWLFGIAIIVAYAANLKSILNLADGACLQKSKYERIEDMLDNPEFKFMMIGFGATQQLLKTSTYSIHRRINDRAEEHSEMAYANSYFQALESLKEAEDTNLGIVMEGSSADFIKPRHCGFYTVGSLDERHYALGFPKGSPLGNTLSREILQLVESGKLQEIKNRWWIPSDSESCLDKGLGSCEGMAPLQIYHLDGPLLFLVVVLLVALLLSIVELILNACCKKEPGTPWTAIFSRDLKEGCCGCVPRGKSDCGKTCKNNDPEI